MFTIKEFRCPDNTDKMLSVHYISPDRRPMITKGLGDCRVTDEALLAETTEYDPPSFL